MTPLDDFDVTVNSGAPDDDVVTISSTPIGDFDVEITGALADPVVSLEFFATPDVTYNGQIRFRGCHRGHDGLIYHFPYYHDYVMVTDPETDTTSSGYDVTGWATQGTDRRKWVDATINPDGKIFAFPHLAQGNIVVDTEADPVTYGEPLTSAGSPISYAFQVRGGGISGDHLFMPTYDTSPGTTTTTRVVNHNTEVYKQFLQTTIDRTGPFYAANPDFATNGATFGALSTESYWGAAAAPNGKVYGVPFGQERILIIDGNEYDTGGGSSQPNAAWQGDDTLTGGVPLSTGNAQPPDAYLAKYTGATLSSINGHIYCMPRHANAILKINTTDDSAIELPLPADYLAFFDAFELSEGGGRSKSLGSVEDIHGRIWGTWWQVPALLWIDPRIDRVGWVDMTSYADASSSGISLNHYAYGARAGDSIYYSPAAAQNVAKMTIS